MVVAAVGVSIEKELLLCSVVVFVVVVVLVFVVVLPPTPWGVICCCSGSSSSFCGHGVEGGVVFFMALVGFIMIVSSSVCFVCLLFVVFNEVGVTYLFVL